ncbi:hypothetical protein [Pseudoalteromonas distincta]|uniref:hypothetical protein n=1 Tax=Pseudoalteromonas distincta TaxID=77608 RepID=UPI0039EB0E59
MLLNYVSNHQSQLLAISNAQLCPFTSVGYVKSLKKRLLESSWLKAKRNNLSREFIIPTLEQLIDFVQDGYSENVIAQGCVEIMTNLPQNANLNFINNLLDEPKLNVLAKSIICKALLQQHSLNFMPLIDITILFLAHTPKAKVSKQTLDSVKSIFVVTSESDTKKLIGIFDNLNQCELVNSPLMSLFLLSLSSEQVNAVSNYASNTLSLDGTLQVLLQSGFVKFILLANAALHKVEKPEQIVALMKRTLGEKLDLLVNFEIQMQACSGNEQAYAAFQQQLQLNWPTFENELSSKRLLAGKALDEHLNAIQKSAMDSYSQAVFNLYTYNQYVKDKKVNAGVPV